MAESRVIDKFNRFPELIAQAPLDASRLLRVLAMEGRNIVVLSIQERSPGTQQTRYGPRRNVIAANPGLPPNTDIGTLVNGITVANRGRFQQAVISQAEYSEALEFGTRHMAARPFMTPMADALEKRADEIFRSFLK
jgi:HK97 gp10 family phage protein